VTTAELERLLDRAGVTPSRRARALSALLSATMGQDGAAQLSLSASDQSLPAGRLRLWLQLAAFLSAHASHYGLWIASWWAAGLAIFNPGSRARWLLIWAALLLGSVPFMLLATWLQGRVMVDAGMLLKRRLLSGTLQLDPEAVRREGAGRLLGRVIESESLELLMVSGGLKALVALIEVLAAVAVLATVSLAHAALLFAWLGLTLWLSRMYLVRQDRWTKERLDLTHDLVEKMIGHRTRMAQQIRERWHEGEEEALTRYAEASLRMDRLLALLFTVVPRGWLVASLAALGLLLAAHHFSTPTVAIALGGILLAHQSLETLVEGIWFLVGAAVGWQQVKPILRGLTGVASPGRPGPAAAGSGAQVSGAEIESVLEADDLVFRYPGRQHAVLQGCDLAIKKGDRLLLEGESGSGKSTLASLLAGLRSPLSGSLKLDRKGMANVGQEEWRRRIMLVPQFQENHVLLGSLALNLLLGRRWPPHAEDLQQAEAVARELGLGPVIDRMPSGLQQIVGENGWQLSQGERSLVFIARALLQDADVLLLDETFGALDPEMLHQALAVVLQRDSALVVIAQ
jgi:ATP-binding cassette, subfamily B, bacterial